MIEALSSEQASSIVNKYIDIHLYSNVDLTSVDQHQRFHIEPPNQCSLHIHITLFAHSSPFGHLHATHTLDLLAFAGRRNLRTPPRTLPPQP